MSKKKTITREDILRIADELRGQCHKSLDSILEEEFGIDSSEVPIELLQTLDDEAMECTSCGWWFDANEIDDDQICEDCRDD